MNKLIVLVLCGVLAALTAQAQPPKSDRDFDGLKGKVHQVTRGSLMPSAPEKSNSGESQTYDEQGNLTASIVVGADSYLRHTYVHLDAQAVLVFWGEKPSIPGSKEDDSRLSARFLYKYDGKGNRIEKSIFRKDGSLASKQTYKYDPKGRRVSESTEVDKEVPEELKFTYDKAGNVIAQISGSRKTIYRYVQFDPSGNWVKRIASSLGIKEGEDHPTMQETTEERFITYY